MLGSNDGTLGGYIRYRTKTLSCPGSRNISARELLGTVDKKEEGKERKACLPGVLGTLGRLGGDSVGSAWFPSWSWYFLGRSLAELQTFFWLLLHYRPFLIPPNIFSDPPVLRTFPFSDGSYRYRTIVTAAPHRPADAGWSKWRLGDGDETVGN